MPRGVLWVLVNCTSLAEATKLGNAALAARHAACFDVVPRQLTRYFWPPKSGKVEEATGALLILETFDEHFDALANLVRARHADRLPFIGAVRIEHVADAYRAWMAGELTSRRRRSRRRA